MGKISFRFAKHLIYIPITIIHNRRTLYLEHCVLDTGAAGTTIEVSKAETIDLLPAPESKIRCITAIGGRESVYTRKLDHLCIAEEVVSDFEIEIGDLQSTFGIDGIIGNDILEAFEMTISYQTKTLSLISRRI